MSNRRSAVFFLVIFALLVGGIFADIAKLEIVHILATFSAVALTVYVAISVLQTERWS